MTALTALPTAAVDEDRARRRVEAVHSENGQQLYGFAIRLGLRHDEAGDLVQEALLRLFRSLRGGEDITDPPAWTFRCAYRLAMDRHRLRRRWEAVVERLAASDSTTSNTDELIVAWGEVDRLPPRQRAVLYLRYRSDLSFETIGGILGMDASSARASAARGIARIRTRLGEDT